ncbi:retrovirus-related pol polyprotein from transposon TNT 1-94, partial [Tanacetum coccineum]
MQVVQIVLWYLDSGCSKHMTGDHSQLRNFVKKFIGTVRFGNDHFGANMGYGDYVIGDSVISRVYYVEGLEHNMFSVGQYYDSDLEVAFRKHSCYVQDTNGVKDLVRGLPRLKFEKDHLCSACQLGKSIKNTHKPKTENTNLEVLNTLHMDLCGPMRVQTINGKKYILVIVDDYSRFTWVKFLRLKDETPEIFPRTPQQNDVVERRNGTLVDAARTMLIFSKALMFLWVEAVATACYTQNRSLIHTLHNKTPYELVHDKKPDLTFFHVFGALCYPINYNKQLILEYSLYTTHSYFSDVWTDKFRARTKSGSCSTFCKLEILFQPMFDEFLEPTRVERPVSPAPAVLVSVTSAGIPSSTTIDQDAPSPSHSSSSSALQSPSLHQGIAAESTLMENNPFAPVDNDPFKNVFVPEPNFEASSSGDLSSAKSPYVSTRKQLATDALWCLYNYVLSKVEAKNFKSAITEDCWFQAIQDEIHEFDRL